MPNHAVLYINKTGESIYMSEIINENILLEKIKLKKRRMRIKARQLGLTHPSVVKCSQELDKLLNEYQGI